MEIKYQRIIISWYVNASFEWWPASWRWFQPNSRNLGHYARLRKIGNTDEVWSACGVAGGCLLFVAGWTAWSSALYTVGRRSDTLVACAEPRAFFGR